jgi:hypothetical protein
MNHKDWEEIFNEEYGPQFIISPATLEKMLLDIQAVYKQAYWKGYGFGFVTVAILAIGIYLH